MMKANLERKKLSSTEQEIDRAIQKVYETYGGNLSAFFADLDRKNGRTSSPKTEGPLKKAEPVEQAKS